jgi:hypothetical protein
MEALILVAASGGPTMFARIGPSGFMSTPAITSAIPTTPRHSPIRSRGAVVQGERSRRRPHAKRNIEHPGTSFLTGPCGGG